MLVERDKIIESFIEVNLADEDSFLKIKETLTRIGIASRNQNKLTQTCHILHRRGKYYIVHFKEMLMLDGKDVNYTSEDKARRNKIATLLEDWDLCKIIEGRDSLKNIAAMDNLKILRHSEKKDWRLEVKYTIGRK